MRDFRQLRFFDQLLIKIHLFPGWTVDPQDFDTYRVIVTTAGSYNRAVELLIDSETATGGNGSTQDLVETLQNGEIIRRFLAQTPSQLTEHGLIKLSEDMGKFGLSVLFRHNHFAVSLSKFLRGFG